MIARCARCQGTFTTERFGVQTCPHCGSEILLSDPGQAGAPAAPPPAPPPVGPASTAPGQEPAWGAPPPGVSGSRPPEPPPAAPPWAPPPPPPYGQGGPPYGPPGGYPPPGYGYRPPPAPELPSPFADRAALGFLAAFWQTTKLVATQPAEFFRRVRIDQPGAAVLFGVLASTVGSAFASLYAFAQTKLMMGGKNPFADAISQLPADAPDWARRVMGWAQDQAEQAGSAAGLLQSLALAPVSAVVSIYLSAGIFHLVLLVLKAAPRGFNATLTVVAYAHALMLVGMLPFCGGVVALVWMVVVLIIGLGEAQRCGAGKAAAAVFSPLALACLCACLGGVLIGVFAAKAIGAAGGGASL
jgi:hypothetical protein